MEKDTRKALKIFYELRNDLNKYDDSLQFKQLNKLISLLESSYFNDIVSLHKSLKELKRQKKVSRAKSIDNCRDDEIADKINVDSHRKKSKVKSVSSDDFNRRVKALVGNRELVHVQINKSNSDETLGLSIKCSGSLHNNAVYVDNVTKGSLADRSGIKSHYQIVAVDNIPLDSPDSNRDIVVQALKTSRSHIDMYLSRDKSTNHLQVSNEVKPRSNHTQLKQLNTEWTEYEVINLSTLGGSFGFGLMAGMSEEVMVRTILSGGAADLDGHLRNDDHIMYINDTPVRHLHSNQVASILKSAGDNIRLIVARPFDQRNYSKTASYDVVHMVETRKLDDRLRMVVAQLQEEESTARNSNTAQPRFSMSYREEGEDYTELLSVQLQCTGSNLGVTVVDLYDEDPNHLGTLQGVFIKEVIVNSVAYKKGIRKYDRLLKINGVPIAGNEITATVYRMMNSTGIMNLSLQRYLSGPSHDKLLKSDFFDTSTSATRTTVIVARTRGQSSEGSSVTDVDIDEFYKRHP